VDHCISERFVVVDDFLPEEKTLSMRADIDAHFADPQNHKPETHYVWNYWHVPGSYTYLKAMPERVIAREKVEAFVQALRTWAAVNVGFGHVTWPFLSMYVPGCSQGVHNDSVNGRLGYVFSLTRNSRKTIGGETIVFQDRDLFRSNLDKPAAGSAIFDLVEPRFNRLTFFDDRVPHAVQRVDGSMDPVEARFVLHGHIRESGVVAQGALHPDAIREPVLGALQELRASIGKRALGPLVYCIEIGQDGEVQRMRPLLDRLVSPTNDDLEPVRVAVAERLGKLRFPEATAPTRANIPLIF
jgi:hypothetical protein